MPSTFLVLPTRFIFSSLPELLSELELELPLPELELLELPLLELPLLDFDFLLGFLFAGALFFAGAFFFLSSELLVPELLELSLFLAFPFLSSPTTFFFLSSFELLLDPPRLFFGFASFFFVSTLADGLAAGFDSVFFVSLELSVELLLEDEDLPSYCFSGFEGSP
jgi:hypothetical protein